MAEPRPSQYRHLEDHLHGYFCDQGWLVWRTGQEYRPDFGRWSPDFLVQTRERDLFYADAKIRHREYWAFLVEDAPLRRAWFESIPTLFVLIVDEPLAIEGCILAEDAWQAKIGDEPRTDHNGNGSGDPYWLIPADALSPAPVREVTFEDLVLDPVQAEQLRVSVDGEWL